MTLASTITRPVAIYREEQNFCWWVYALLALMAATGIAVSIWQGQGEAERAVGSWSGQVPVVLLVGLTVPSVLVLGVLRMTTEVTPSECRIWFGWIPTFQYKLALDTVSRVEVVKYRPLADCGGWGIRRSRSGERVYNARGDRGVRVELADGTRLLIGSQMPEELERALKHGMRPTAIV